MVVRWGAVLALEALHFLRRVSAPMSDITVLGFDGISGLPRPALSTLYLRCLSRREKQRVHLMSLTSEDDELLAGCVGDGEHDVLEAGSAEFWVNHRLVPRADGRDFMLAPPAVCVGGLGEQPVE